MTESDIIDSGIPVARLSNVTRHGFGCVEVEWAEGDRAGKTEIVDLRPAIYAYKVYRPLRSDPLLFGTVHLIEEDTLLRGAAKSLWICLPNWFNRSRQKPSRQNNLQSFSSAIN